MTVKVSPLPRIAEICSACSKVIEFCECPVCDICGRVNCNIQGHNNNQNRVYSIDVAVHDTRANAFDFQDNWYSITVFRVKPSGRTFCNTYYRASKSSIARVRRWQDRIISEVKQ